MYDIRNQTNVRPVGKDKWNKHFVITENGFQSFICLLLLPQTLNFSDWLQFRINQFILTTNNFIYNIVNMDTNLCTYGEDAEETI